MTSPAPPQGKKFYLFGYPIAHSAAPALHNHCFASWAQATPNQYDLWSTTRVTEEMLDLFEAEEFGGAAVTMPLKTAILPYLDEVSPESRITGACNTIVKVPTPAGGYKLVGQNTDILGVRNALLQALRLQFPEIHIPSSASYSSTPFAPSPLPPSSSIPQHSSSPSPSPSPAALIIGGGATTRSAAYALSLLGLAPIFLISRDSTEVRAVQDAMRSAGVRVVHLRDAADVRTHLGEGAEVLMAVGAIPAIPPSTEAEHRVYDTLSAVLSLPYTYSPSQSAGGLPVPRERIYLEMAYTPNPLTPLLQLAHQKGWDPVDGVRATVQQGLAQQRMWWAREAGVDVGGGGEGIFGGRMGELEEEAREVCLAQLALGKREGRVEVEVDRGAEKEDARVRRRIGGSVV